jgi:hypothetical protein
MTTGISFAGVIRAEWTKLRSLRSTWLTLGITASLAAATAGAIGYGVGRAGAPPPTVAEAVSAAFLPIDFLVLAIAVLGVLQMSGEYGSGLIRATLTAVPSRLPVLFAKALVLAVVTAPVMAAACLASFVACQAFIDDGASLTDPGVPRAILGAVACPVLMAVLGLGVGAMLRSTAAGITVLVAGLFIVPVLLGPVLPGDREDEVMKYVPTVAGQAMYSVDGSGGPFETLSPGASAGVLLGWAALGLAGGAAVLRRRDA